MSSDKSDPSNTHEQALVAHVLSNLGMRTERIDKGHAMHASLEYKA